MKIYEAVLMLLLIAYCRRAAAIDVVAVKRRIFGEYRHFQKNTRRSMFRSSRRTSRHRGTYPKGKGQEDIRIDYE